MDVPSRLATCISAAEKLRIADRRILHVGDDLTTDNGWRYSLWDAGLLD